MLLSRNGRSNDQARNCDANCQSLVDHDSQSHTYASIPDFELNAANSYQHANLNFDKHCHCDSYRNLYGYRFSYAVPSADFYIYSYSNQHADAYRDSDADLNADQDRYAFSPSDTYFHSDLYFHCDADTDLNADHSPHLYANFYTNPVSYGYCFSNEYCCGHSLMNIATFDYTSLDRLEKSPCNVKIING